MVVMRCGCYARFSSDLQRQTSIDDQLAVARRYAAPLGWAILAPHVYTDEGVSGISIEGRPGIQALLAAAQTTPRPFDVLLVDDSSRVARDLRDALLVMRLLKFAGIRTIYISQQIDSDNEQAETLLTVHGLVDGLYLQEMSKKIKRGLVGQLERGYHTGGRTYGYHTTSVYDPSGKRDANGPIMVGKQIAIDPEAAAIIRRIYDAYADGTPIPRLIDQLTDEGVPAPRGGRWTMKTIRRVLQNERYRGFQIYGQHRCDRRPGTNQRVQRRQPREAWHMRERPDLRIVSDAQWERVTARRSAIQAGFKVHPGPRNLARGRSALYSPHLFSGFMRCGTCGGTFCTVSGGQGSPRYGCATRPATG